MSTTSRPYSDRAYRVEPTKGKCSHCESENAPYFDVIGPDGDAQGTTFAEEVDAEEHANALNGAYDEGLKAGPAKLKAAIDALTAIAALDETKDLPPEGGTWTDPERYAYTLGRARGLAELALR